jgi:outer membrane biosynthesis protein TonB
MDAEELIKQAAESMRAAIDAAQGRAEEIVREAEEEAQRIRAEAEAKARRARTNAEAEAQRRLDEVRSALDALQGKLSAAAGSEVDPGPVTVPEPEPPATPEPAPDRSPEPMPEPTPEPTPDPVPEPIPPPGEADPPAPQRQDGDAAARLVAMKLALDGASRDDARKRLAAEYDLPDLDALLDEVYSKAGK